MYKDNSLNHLITINKLLNNDISFLGGTSVHKLATVVYNAFDESLDLKFSQSSFSEGGANLQTLRNYGRCDQLVGDYLNDTM